jgi:hypothetical protein
MDNYFVCLNCGKKNPSKCVSHTYKYCNNSCQQQYKSKLLVEKWQNDQKNTVWRQVPDYIKRFLIEARGATCECCGGTMHFGKPIPLVVHHRDGNTNNNAEENLEVICPNCRAQK